MNTTTIIIWKDPSERREQAVTEKEALESSIRRDSIMHKKILDDLRLSTNNNMGGSRNKRSTYRPLSYDDMRTTEESEKFSLSTSAISKALEDVDHGLLTFVSEEEAAEAPEDTPQKKTALGVGGVPMGMGMMMPGMGSPGGTNPLAALKARKAAKAKEESRAAVEVAGHRHPSPEELMQGLLINHITCVDCKHDYPLLSDIEAKIYVEFIETFIDAFASNGFDGMLEAQVATKEKYLSMYYSSKLNAVISILLSRGTQMVLEGENKTAQVYAMLAFYFEDYIAVCTRNRATMNMTKLVELERADDHTLVSYYRKRISCSCLDKKYKEVKSVKKVGWCCNPNCSQPERKVERSKMLCCTRCGMVHYCSVECQRASWKEHKMICNVIAERRTAFNADQS